MKTTLREITVEELVKNFRDDVEEGVYGFNDRLTIRPAYQREFCYKIEQQQAVIGTILKDLPLGLFHWSKTDEDSYEVLDGQQRTLSICYFIAGRFAIKYDNKELYFSNLEVSYPSIANKILGYKLLVYVCEGTNSEKLEWFRTINIAGEKLTNQELLNATYVGSWLTDAKKKFSKNSCVAYKLGEKLMTGTPIRQDYLETVLEWISDRDNLSGIDSYMAKHQLDNNADDLWNYFQDVIKWVNKNFTKYRKEMKGLPWGILYNKYYTNTYNAADLEEGITRLMSDEDVTCKKGIYEYLLSNKEKEMERKLSIRTFSERQKREAYERQQGICPICGEYHEFEDMEADHIIPWSQGGTTTDDNLQMLCKKCNRNKSDK